MQEKILFEYAVIRVVPRVEREEFMNIGVVLFCKRPRYLHALFHLDKDRLQAFAPDLPVEEVELHLRSFERICCAARDGGPIAKLDHASRFRWLTAMRSTVVQTSRVHPGFCDDPAVMLERLHQQLVL